MKQLTPKISTLLDKFTQKLEPLNLIEINSKSILENFLYFQKLNPKNTIIPVLKSNAYGHGISEIVSILKNHTKLFMADSYLEALQVWQVAPQAKVILIGSILPQNLSLLDFSKLSITLQDPVTLHTLLRLKRPINVHLKINTGMHRQGIDPLDLPAYLKIIKAHPFIQLEGVSSHLSDADNPDNAYTQKQYYLFKVCLQKVYKAELKPAYVHLSATSGVLKIQDPDTNTIRLGIGLYGYNPLTPLDSNYQKYQALTPALTLKSKFIQIQHIKKGEDVSYNRTFTTKKDMVLGIIPLGYHEGIDRRLSNCGFVKYKNKFLPIVGRVCMNLTIVDLLDQKAKLFDEVEVISPVPSDLNSIQNMVSLCQTIPYEILVHLHNSIHRKIF